MNIENEIWKPIEGYEGLYEVSNFGNVRSLNFNHTGEIRDLKLATDKKGYLLVGLFKNAKLKHFLVHRLVSKTFLENPLSLQEVNHKDEDKKNNSVENLEWCTRAYNINYGTRTDRISKPVLQFTKNGEFVKEWKSTRECGRNGFNQGAVWSCCRGKVKSHAGFIWKYKNN